MAENGKKIPKDMMFIGGSLWLMKERVVNEVRGGLRNDIQRKKDAFQPQASFKS